MIINYKQILQLIAIANLRAANLHILGETLERDEIFTLLAEISQQQHDQLKEVKECS